MFIKYSTEIKGLNFKTHLRIPLEYNFLKILSRQVDTRYYKRLKLYYPITFVFFFVYFFAIIKIITNIIFQIKLNK